MPITIERNEDGEPELLLTDRWGDKLRIQKDEDRLWITTIDGDTKKEGRVVYADGKDVVDLVTFLTSG